MNEQQALTFIVEVLEIEEGSEITLETSLEDIFEWDSIGALSIIEEADDEHDIDINPNDMEAALTIGDVIKLLI